MQYIMYTVTAVILYLLSDWILNQIEVAVGNRLKYRSVVFFVIIMSMALVSFNLLDQMFGEPVQLTPATETTPAGEQ